MVTIHDVSEDDVLECVFYSQIMECDVRVALDVNVVSEEYNSIIGTVLIVKNMPFDVLEDTELRLNLDDDEVEDVETNYGPLVGKNIRLLSV